MSDIEPTRVVVLPNESIPPLPFAGIGVSETDIGTVSYSDVSLSPEATGTLIRLLEWSGFPWRLDERHRSSILGHAASMRVVVPATPGVRKEHGWLPEEVSEQVRSGDFSTISRAQWQALEGEQLPEVLNGFGMSLGASLLPSMVAEAGEREFERLILWDPIAKEKMGPGRLAVRLARENKDWPAYREENPDWMVRPNGQMRWSDFSSPRAGNFSYPQGLSSFSIVESLGSALERGTIDRYSTEITLISGAKSRVTPEKEMHGLTQRIRSELGMNAVRWLVLEGESHGMLDSNKRLSSLFSYLFGTGYGSVKEL